jgi:hypothetical protein
VPENAELPRQESLDWDGYGEQESLEGGRPLESTRAWSTNTLRSGLNSEADGEQYSSSEDDFLSPTSNDDVRFSEFSAAAADRMDAVALRRKVERTIMEADEDVLPFKGKKVTLSCLSKLCTLAVSLKKDLQVAHLELAEDAVYLENHAAAASECRKRLSSFIVQAESDRVLLEQEDRDHRSEATAAAAARASAVSAAKQPFIARQLATATEELEAVRIELTKLSRAAGPANDEELFDKSEQLRALDERMHAAVQDGKDAAKLGMDNDMLVDAAQVEEQVNMTKKAKTAASEKLLEWRRKAGVWAEKKKRGPARVDLKLPNFSPGLSAQLTVYEFEKEWQEYRTAMEYSTEEALRTLKLAVQPPARAEVSSYVSEQEIFDYLRKHYGNPMVLLNACEKDVRAWGMCQGSDMDKREWLIQAKTKLEAMVKLCKAHNIEKYLHFSNVAGEI